MGNFKTFIDEQNPIYSVFLFVTTLEIYKFLIDLQQ